MPEHREKTPEHLRDLESFLWWDFEPVTWRKWAETRGWSTGSGDFDKMVEIQQALRALERENNGMEAGSNHWKRLNQAVREHGILPVISTDGGVTLGQRKADPLGHVVCLALQAMQEDFWKRFKICRDGLCSASYYDSTRNGAKTWCSMDTCGSRNKMRRYRARSA